MTIRELTAIGDEMEPGPELDALIAEKVMGWKRLTCGQCKNRPWLPAYIPCAYWHNQDGKETAPIFDIYSGGMSDRLQETAWNPSTNIAAAWVVVENLSTGKSRHLFDCLHRDEGGKWIFGAFDRDGIWSPAGSAETAPHAICLAALKTIGSVKS